MHCNKFSTLFWSQSLTLTTFLFIPFLPAEHPLPGCWQQPPHSFLFQFLLQPSPTPAYPLPLPLSSTQWSEWILDHIVAVTSYHSQSENSRPYSDSLCLPRTSTVTLSLLSHFCPYSPLTWTHQPSSCFPRSPGSSCPKTLTLRALLSRMFYPRLLHSWPLSHSTLCS